MRSRAAKFYIISIKKSDWMTELSFDVCIRTSYNCKIF